MFRKNHSARAASGRASLYDDITDKIIAELETKVKRYEGILQSLPRLHR